MIKNSGTRTPSVKTSKLLDTIGRMILFELQNNARIPFSELGRRVGLSTPAVMERVRKLEDAKIIRGYRARVDPEKFGYNIRAFIAINVVGDFQERIIKISRETPEILECDRVTGDNSYILKVAVASVTHLQALIDTLTPFVETTASVVLSAVVTERAIEPTEGSDVKEEDLEDPVTRNRGRRH